MTDELSGFERRLNELNERLLRLGTMLDEERSAFDRNAFLRDVAERNLEVAAQCVIDICHRVVALEGAQKPTDYYEAILRMGEIGVLPTDFAERLAPIAGSATCSSTSISASTGIGCTRVCIALINLKSFWSMSTDGCASAEVDWSEESTHPSVTRPPSSPTATPPSTSSTASALASTVTLGR